MKQLNPSFRPLLTAVLVGALLGGCSSSKTETAENSNEDKTTTGKQYEVAREEPSQTEQVKSAPPSQPSPQPIREAMVMQETAVMQDAYSAPQAGISGAKAKMRVATQHFNYAPGLVQEQDTEQYAEQKVNPAYTTDKDPVSTFSVDVDTASYSNVRRFLNQGEWPTKGAVRVEEMINYFNYNYPVPDSTEQPFTVNTELAVSPWNPETRLMRVALKGYQTEKTDLPPMNLVFLIDVSGSMHNNDKLPLLKRSFSLLTRQLRPQDKVSIVVYAGASGLVLEPTAGDKPQEILAALDKLSAGGSTNGGAGIHLAYQTAKANFVKDGINRVILASDGDFNVGTTSITQLKDMVKKQKKSGVFLSILGFGQGNYNDHLTEELSNIGNGNAFYIDNFKEARKVFSDGLTGTLQTIAKDVKIQVEFNPAYVAEYRLIGYDNRQLKREDFKNDKVDAGDIGAGHTVTAFYELVMQDAKFSFNSPLRYQTGPSEEAKGVKNNELAYVKLRYKTPDADTSQLLQQPVLLKDIKPRFEQASDEFQFAAAVAAFGEKLRDSQYIDYSFEQIRQIATTKMGNDPWGYRHEFVQLTDNAMVIETADN